MSDIVAKTDGQVMSLIGDIMSLFQQLKQEMSAGDIAEMEPEENIDENPLAELEKGLESTPSDGATANDSAEEKIDDPVPEGSQKAVDEIAKAIANILNGSINKKAEKSAPKNTNTEMVKVLHEVSQVVKSLNDKQKENEFAITSILRGLGVADVVEKQAKAEAVKKGLNNPADVNNTIEYLAKALQKLQPEDQKSFHGYNSQKDEIAKSLANKDLLTFMIKKQ